MFKKIKRKNLILGMIFLVVLSAIIFPISNKGKVNQEVKEIQKNLEVKDVIKDSTYVAVCPTYQSLRDELIEDGFEVIKTNSTSESISLLRNGSVNLVISGRKPKSAEIDLKYKAVQLEGHYSFLSEKSLTIYEDNLSLYDIYTDQDTEKVKKIFKVENIAKVDNVYEYLDKGIVITSWNNTDYSRSSVVHILNFEGTRNPKSRMPFIYYSTNANNYVDVIEEVAINNLKESQDEN
jgi:hypothetical protein